MGPPRRIAIVGTSGSGKTTLARAVSERVRCDHIELDAIHHLPGWQPIDPDEMRAIVQRRTEGDRWVVDGNYVRLVGDIVLARADTVVWLDLPRRIVVPRVIGRTLVRIVRREALWNGNRERVLKLIDPRPAENIILWAWTQRDVYRERYSALRAEPAYPHLEWHHLVSTRRIRDWLAGLPDATMSSRDGAVGAPSSGPEDVARRRDR